MEEALLEIGRSLNLMTWGLVFIAFLTFLGLAVSVFGAWLVGREGRRSSEILREMREDSKRMQFYLFSKFGPADLR
ncbi:MAG: hypothetical protein ACREQY_18435 [Candidatus Binatia bacterium]